MIFIKCFLHRVHLFIAIPCFGNQHHHYMRQAATCHRQQLDHIIQAGRVRLIIRNDRHQYLHFFFSKQGRSKPLLTCLQPVQVSLQCIDLTIVSNIAEGLCQSPGRKCIGSKTAMHQTKCTHHSFIAEVRIVGTELHAGQLPFVHNCFIRKRSDIKTDRIFFHCVQNGMRCIFLQHK